MCHATVNIKGFAHALHGAELFCIQIYRHVAVIDSFITGNIKSFDSIYLIQVHIKYIYHKL